MQLILAAIAFYLVARNRGNEPVQIYWTLVTIYWVLNYYQRRNNS